MSIPREDLIMLAPLIATLAGAVLALIADAFGQRKLAVGAVVLGLAGGGGAAIWLAIEEESRVVIDLLAVGGGFSAIVGVLLCLGTLAVLGGWEWFTTSAMGAGAAVLVAFVCAASIGLATSIDLLVMIICLEALAICGYALTSQARTPASAEASVKYVIQGSVSTGFLMLAFAILYGIYGGRTGLEDLRIAIDAGATAPAIAALGLTVVAFGYKLSAFPFHSWAPDVFETAPPASAGAMATVPKIAAVTGALLVFTVTFGAARTDRLPWLWMALAAGSIVFGNLVALKQMSYTRMLAYSGVAQIGYVLVGLAGLKSTTAAWSVKALLVLVCAYGLAAVTAFVAAEAVRLYRPGWDRSIAGLGGLGREHPVLGVSMAVAMFSLTGMPLTAGFWGKFGVFGAALTDQSTWIVVMAWIGILGSVVSFGYYGRVLRALFFDSAEEDPATGRSSESDREPGSPLAAVFACVLGAALLLGVGIVPAFRGLEWLYEFVNILA